MEPAKQKPVIPPEAREFLPDADEIESRSPPRPARSILYLLVGFMVLAVAWAAVSEVDRLVSARGQLVTTPPPTVVQPLETAIVRRIAVKVGQTVRQGDVLAELDPTFATADRGQLESRLASIKAQIRRLEAELEGVEFVATAGNPEEHLQGMLHSDKSAARAARLLAFQESVARTEAGLAAARAESTSLRQGLSYLQQIEQMRSELLAEKSGSRLNLLQAQVQRTDLERELQSAENRIKELAREQARIEAEKAAFLREWGQKAAEELVSAKRERDGITEELHKAIRRNDMAVLRAPFDAMVLKVAPRSAGSVVEAAEPLFTLVPVGATLEAEAKVLASDIGFVRPDDLARIKIDAFPFQKHGTLDAKVAVISEDAFAKDENGVPAAREGLGSEAFYLIRLELASSNGLRAVPDSTRLMPGMTLSAEIVVGKRTILSYFLYPMLRAFDESIRER
jgi:hemolysin D